MRVYLINRDRDEIRRKHFVSQCPEWFSVTRVTAVDGHSSDIDWSIYAAYNRNNFWGKNTFKPGAFACFLSHANAWSRVAKGNEEWALICEDDVVLLDNINTLESIYSKCGLDILHVNERLSSWVPNDVDGVESFYNLNFCLNNILEQAIEFSSDGPRPNPGTCGYVINKKAARALLTFMEISGIECGVDWFVVAAGLDGSQITIEKIEKHKTLRFLSKYYQGKEPRVLSGILKEPMTLERPHLVGGTVLNHEISLDFDVFGRS